MLYEEYVIRFIQTSKLSHYERKFARLVNGSFYHNQDKAIEYPWVAIVSGLRVYHGVGYRPGLIWCADFAVGAKSPVEALKLAKYNIDMRIKVALSQGLYEKKLRRICSRSIDRHCKNLVKKIQAKRKELKKRKMPR